MTDERQTEDGIIRQRVERARQQLDEGFPSEDDIGRTRRQLDKPITRHPEGTEGNDDLRKAAEKAKQGLDDDFPDPDTIRRTRDKLDNFSSVQIGGGIIPVQSHPDKGFDPNDGKPPKEPSRPLDEGFGKPTQKGKEIDPGYSPPLPRIPSGFDPNAIREAGLKSGPNVAVDMGALGDLAQPTHGLPKESSGIAKA